MMLSKNFSLHEMTMSQVAIRRDIDNEPSEEAIHNLKLLCEFVLEPVRLLLPEDDVLMISSGFRSIYLNQAVGGARTSQHTKGQAADTYARKTSVDDLYALIRASSINFDQCIWEFGSSGWIHLSYNHGNNRREFLKAIKDENGKTLYFHD